MTVFTDSADFSPRYVRFGQGGVEEPCVSDDDAAALTAHWLLGRLSVLQATISHLATAEDLSLEARADLAARARVVADQMQDSLELMARGMSEATLSIIDDAITIVRD